MSPASAPPEPEAEQELDFGRFWWRIVARWWLVAAAVAAGAVIGYLVSLGGGTTYQAKATVYLGQPLSPSGNSQVQSLQTNPATVGQIVKSRSVILSVASKVGVEPDELREGISSKGVGGVGPKTASTQLVEVAVRGPWRRQSADAANLLAETVVERVSDYADTKIAQFTELLVSREREIGAVEESIERYRAALETDRTLSSAEKLVLVSLLGEAERERGQLVEQRTEGQLSLSLAQNVERAQVVTRAAATKVEARSRRTSMIVGGVVGLVAGVVLALLWEPVRRRVARAGGS